MSAGEKGKWATGLERLLVKIEELWEDPENLRKHEARSTDAIAASLRRFGQRKVIVALESGKVIAGNGTFRAAKGLGWTHLAVVRWLGTEEEARAFGIADNRTGELSEWDEVALMRAMVKLAEQRPELAYEVGFSVAEIKTFQRALETDAEVMEKAMGEGGGVPRVHAGHLEFQDEEELAEWYAFMRVLTGRFPECQTAGQKIVAYVRSL